MRSSFSLLGNLHNLCFLGPLLVVYMVIMAKVYTELETIDPPDPNCTYGPQNFTASLSFVFTSVTTTGFGNIAPCTFEGRVCFIVFNKLGIIIWDTFNRNSLKFIIGLIIIIMHQCRIWCRRKSHEEWMPPFSQIAVILLLILMMFTSSVCSLYMYHEGWTFITALYYCIVAFSTTGFGDLVSDQDIGHKKLYDFGNGVILLIGTCLHEALKFTCVSIMESLTDYFLAKRFCEEQIHRGPIQTIQVSEEEDLPVIPTVAFSGDDVHFGQPEEEPEELDQEATTKANLLTKYNKQVGATIIQQTSSGDVIIQIEEPEPVTIEAAQSHKFPLPENLQHLRCSGVLLTSFMLIMASIYKELESPTNDDCPNSYKWTFSATLFFVFTSFSTTGFGNIAPCTTGGRLCFIIFNLFGNIFWDSFNRNFSRLVIDAIIFVMLKTRTWYTRKRLSHEEWIPHFYQISIVVFIIIMVYTTSICFFYMPYEDWSFTDAIYYCMVAYSTTGLGDLLSGQIDDHSNLYIFANGLSLLIGTCLHETFKFTCVSLMESLTEYVVSRECFASHSQRGPVQTVYISDEDDLPVIATVAFAGDDVYSGQSGPGTDTDPSPDTDPDLDPDPEPGTSDRGQEMSMCTSKDKLPCRHRKRETTQKSLRDVKVQTEDTAKVFR